MTKNRAIKIPQKSRFYMRGAARVIQANVGINESTALHRLYRGVRSGNVIVVRYLGVMMVEREELERIVKGD